MYALLWWVLPGKWWLKTLLLLVLVATVLFALATCVFPWVDAIVTTTEEGTVTARTR